MKEDGNWKKMGIGKRQKTIKLIVKGTVKEK